MPDPAAEHMAALFAGLANPVRLTILAQVIAQPDITNQEVMAACELPQSTVTHHLAKLEWAGLVVRQKRTIFAHYTATALAETLLAIAEEPPPAEPPPAEPPPAAPRPAERTSVDANRRRQQAGAAAQIAQARADLAILDGTPVPSQLLAAGAARLSYPNDSLAQLGVRLGVTKDVVAGRLRRLHRWAEQKVK